jgi:Carboxypeptidase regulatory-like domain/TonB-dependent Receptor Plug Domain
VNRHFSKLAAFVLFLTAGAAFAQSTRGTIAGTITDSSGAVLTGATVEVEAQGGGTKRSATTGVNGEFRIEALDVGIYVVAASAPNFARTQLNNVEVNASQTTPVNIRLAVGRTSDTVTVEASGARVQTETGELSGVISQTEIKDLPILTGNPYALAEILPGVAPSSQRDSFTNGEGFSVDGLRPRANNFLIDGFDNNDNGIAGQALQPTNQEAVSEVVVLKNSYSAEYGRGGGSLSNLTFKSGTNIIHGSLWEQYSGNALFAVTPEEAASGLTKTPHAVNNLFGFRVGGPILKNKLYYFGTSQWTRNFGAPNPLPVQLTLPTAAGVATLQSLGPNNNAQILINSLAGLRASVSDGNPIPIGNRPGCPAPCSVDVGLFTRTDTTKGLSRDYTATEADTVFVRYTDTYSSLTPDLFANNTALPSADTLQGGPARNLGVMWAHTFSPRVINELRFSGQLINFGFNPTAATLANPLAHVPGLALASSLGNTVFGGFSQATFPQGRSHKTIQFQDAVSFTRGTHTFKLGADVAVLLVQDQIPFNSDGTIVFSPGGDCSALGLTTCTDLANYLDNFSGPSGTLNKQFGNPTVSVPTTQQAYYFQDSWKLRPNFTLEYGVRYEFQPPDASNVLPFPAVNRATALTAPFQQKTEVQPDRDNWGPRFGFSYGPRFWQGLFGQDKTVIRGGFGVFYDAFFTNISNNTAATAPNTLGGNILGGPTSRGTANALQAVSAITPTVDPTNLVEAVVSNLQNPLTYQWNLNVQRELPGKLIAEVAYVGTRGERLWVNEQLNPVDPTTGLRLNPNKGSIIVRGNRGDSIYHGLQTQLSRNVGKLSLIGSYTFSRAIDNQSEVFASSGGASRWEVLNNPRSDRGPSAFDHKHRAVITWVYSLPSPSSSILKTILGGWVSTGSASFTTGPPETVYLGGWDQNGDGEAFNDRPFLGNPKAPVNESPACLASATCVTGVGFNDGSGNLIDFIQALFGGGGNGVTLPISASQAHFIVFNQGSGKNGNVGRNSFYFPGRQLWNLGAIKRFPIPYRESQLEFRADFFDAFNHPNEGADNLVGFGNLLNPGVFGNFKTTKGDGRTIQFWLKYSF